jgi:hypothetical protein
MYRSANKNLTLGCNLRTYPTSITRLTYSSRATAERWALLLHGSLHRYEFASVLTSLSNALIDTNGYH